MQRSAFRALSALFLMIFGLGVFAFAGPSASAEPAGTRLDLPCAYGVYVQSMTKSFPASADGQALVSARITIEPGGGYDPHFHPGTLNVFIDSGEFAFTLLEDHDGMMVNRAATGDAEAMIPNEPMVLNAGDWLTEIGMVHEAWNIGDEPVVVILSGLVDPDQPLTQCVDPSASTRPHNS